MLRHLSPSPTDGASCVLNFPEGRLEEGSAWLCVWAVGTVGMCLVGGGSHAVPSCRRPPVCMCVAEISSKPCRNHGSVPTSIGLGSGRGSPWLGFFLFSGWTRRLKAMRDCASFSVLLRKKNVLNYRASYKISDPVEIYHTT